MAEAEQRTEEATPRKRQRMRDEGQIARSADATSAAALAAAGIGLAATGSSLVHELSVYAIRCFWLADVGRPYAAIGSSSSLLFPVMVPIVAGGVAAIAVGLAQSRMFSFTVIMPKLQRLDPLTHLGNLMPGKQQLIEIGKQLLKLGAIGYVVYSLIAAAMPMFAVLSATSPTEAASFVASIVVKLFIRVSIAFALVAGLDYWLALRKFNEDAKMSKDEVKDERKQEDGNPEIRARIRRKMRELLKNRGVREVAKATVVVTNPTHFAVALRYLPEKDMAPVVLCKGKDELALEMRREARRHQVPMVENRPLARALYKDSKVGRPIPSALYRSVAEVIAFVMQLNRRHATRVARGDA
jgi:flagellar biosynthesis protein FlhB